MFLALVTGVFSPTNDTAPPLPFWLLNMKLQHLPLQLPYLPPTHVKPSAYFFPLSSENSVLSIVLNNNPCLHWELQGTPPLGYNPLMPITKSAIKKQRVDKKRTKQNLPLLGRVKTSIKEARIKATPDKLKIVYSTLDRAVKHHLVPKRRAARLKSRIAKKSKKN